MGIFDMIKQCSDSMIIKTKIQVQYTANLKTKVIFKLLGKIFG